MLRLIDLHCDWLLQYAGESTVFDPALYGGVGERLGQSEGYLTGASAAVLACFRRADDWAKRADAWGALGELLARIEAEFSGRLLMGPDDLARWREDADGLCWGVIGVEGFDALVKEPHDLARLRGLFERGVRVFQPVYTAANELAGSSTPGDERGLTDLGRAFLRTLGELAKPDGGPGPRPVVDLAHMNPASASEVLAWFEADTQRSTRVVPLYSHGAFRHEGFSGPRAITPENLARLRALGGFVGFSVGPPFYETREALRAGIEAAAALPFRGRAGFEGLAIGTDFLGVDKTQPGLGNVSEVVSWVFETFPEDAATALVSGNASKFVAKITTGASSS